MVDGHDFAGRYASVKRFVRKLDGSPAPEARVVIETAPGGCDIPVTRTWGWPWVLQTVVFEVRELPAALE